MTTYTTPMQLEQIKRLGVAEEASEDAHLYGVQAPTGHQERHRDLASLEKG